jgi:tetratricopeptide (TPR) repeat protein
MRYPLLLQDAAYAQFQAGNVALATTLIDRQIADYGVPTAIALELVGNIAHSQGRAEQALEAWGRSALLQPSATVYFKRALLEEQRGNGSAAQSLRGLAEQTAGIEHFRKDRIEEARAALVRAAAADANLPQVWFYLGECESLLGVPGRARLAYERCLALAPQHARADARLSRRDDSAESPATAN